MTVRFVTKWLQMKEYLTEAPSAEEGGTALAVTGGVPLGIKVTFISKREGRPLPYGFARYISLIHSRRGGFHIRPFGVSGAYGMLPYGAKGYSLASA
jgi:hypothetical protein